LGRGEVGSTDTGIRHATAAITSIVFTISVLNVIAVVLSHVLR